MSGKTVLLDALSNRVYSRRDVVTLSEGTLRQTEGTDRYYLWCNPDLQPDPDKVYVSMGQNTSRYYVPAWIIIQ